MFGFLALLGIGAGAAVDGIDKSMRNAENKEKWKNNPRPNGVYYGDSVYLDWKGQERDIKTNQRVTITKDYVTGERILRDKNFNPIRNLSSEEDEMNRRAALNKPRKPWETVIEPVVKKHWNGYSEKNGKRMLRGARYIDIETGEIFFDRMLSASTYIVMSHSDHGYYGKYRDMFLLHDEILDEIEKNGRRVYNDLSLWELIDKGLADEHVGGFVYVNERTKQIVRWSDHEIKSRNADFKRGEVDRLPSKEEDAILIKRFNRAQKIRRKFLTEDYKDGVGTFGPYGLEDAICSFCSFD